MKMMPRLLILCVVVVLLLGGGLGQDNDYGVTAIYQFGDSLSDTGNFIRETPSGADSTYASLPYGQTFFHHPTGRCSDGLIMVDYFAQYFKLPFVDPYLKKDGDFTHGANFAVAGSTALDVSTLASKNISASRTNSSLSVQLKWFRSHLNSICSSPSDCRNKLRNALFVLGEIGGNDINYAMYERKGMEEVRKLVPEVVQAIKNVAEELIALGSIRVVVPGNLPFGCTPIYLARFKEDDPTMYDELKCLKHFNDFAKFQNDQLQRAIKELQQKYPHVAIVYGDYFGAYRHILRFARALGFEEEATVKACCGGGNNTYNFDGKRMCGFQGVSVCPNPQTYVSWDGVHLTSHAYQHMARSFLEQITKAISHVGTSLGNQPKASPKLKFISPFLTSLVLNEHSRALFTEISIRSFSYAIAIVIIVLGFLLFRSKGGINGS